MIQRLDLALGLILWIGLPILQKGLQVFTRIELVRLAFRRRVLVQRIDRLSFRTRESILIRSLSRSVVAVHRSTRLQLLRLLDSSSGRLVGVCRLLACRLQGRRVGLSRRHEEGVVEDWLTVVHEAVERLVEAVVEPRLVGKRDVLADGL